MIRPNKSPWCWSASQLTDEERGRKNLEDGFQRDWKEMAVQAETFELWKLSFNQKMHCPLVTMVDTEEVALVSFSFINNDDFATVCSVCRVERDLIALFRHLPSLVI